MGERPEIAHDVADLRSDIEFEREELHGSIELDYSTAIVPRGVPRQPQVRERPVRRRDLPRDHRPVRDEIMVVDHFLLPRWLKISRPLMVLPPWVKTWFANWPALIGTSKTTA